MNKFFVSTSLFFSLLFLSCNSNREKTNKGINGAFAKVESSSNINVDRIINSGELIIATISGPDTYFDYQGVDMGLQYALAEDFAQHIGVGIRVVLVNDTTELYKKLQLGEADMIAVQLPIEYIQKQGFLAAGASVHTKHTQWAVRKDEVDFAESLNDWFGKGIELNIEKKEEKRFNSRHQVYRKVRAPFISREKNIISTYDHYFKEAAAYTGWDWRLIAAQCYQESGFDPNAVSWAGAKGLMQLMPSTAKKLSLDEHLIFRPKENIATAAKLIRQLQNQFAYIHDKEEQIQFILAAYNGGIGHVNDARALTQKYGGNPNKWNDVCHYIINLSNARYYRDPVVKYGYMIGSETFHYVQNIMQRWSLYGGDISRIKLPHPSPQMNDHKIDQQRVRKRNRFSKEHKILKPSDFRIESSNTDD